MHGSTQSPAGWDRLASALGTCGHHVTAIDLPPGRPEWTVADYAREAAAQAGEPAGRRVVVGHSGAGVLLPAIADATQQQAAVWLAAYIPDLAGGHSMAEDIAAHRDAIFHADWLGVDPASDPNLAVRFLFHDCDQPPGNGPWAPCGCSTPAQPSTSTHQALCRPRSPAPLSCRPATGHYGPTGCAKRHASVSEPSRSKSARATAPTSPNPRSWPTSWPRPEPAGAEGRVSGGSQELLPVS